MDDPKSTKERVREYMERRHAERRQSDRQPVHDMEQIRRELGWDLTERRKSERRGG